MPRAVAACHGGPAFARGCGRSPLPVAVAGGRVPLPLSAGRCAVGGVLCAVRHGGFVADMSFRDVSDTVDKLLNQFSDYK